MVCQQIKDVQVGILYLLYSIMIDSVPLVRPSSEGQAKTGKDFVAKRRSDPYGVLVVKTNI